MDAEGLKLKIDSKGAQQDLAALSKVLDKTAGSADKLDKAFARAAVSTDQNLTRAAKSMEKYAQVAALLSKIKVAGNPTGQIQELGKALDQIGRAKQINMQQVAAVKELGAALGSLRVTDRVLQVANTLNALGRVRLPTQAQARNLREFFQAMETYKGTGSSEQLSRLLNTLSNIKAPSAATIGRLQQMFTVLAEAKEMPGAGRIANQLDTIALAAARASKAMASIPGGGARTLLTGGSTPRSPTGAGAGGAAIRQGAGALNKTLGESEEAGRKAAGSFAIVGKGLDDLSGRFRLSYQAGTLLTTMFASFTAGQFLRSLYDTNISLLKLQKAMLFATGTFQGANDATSAYIGISQKLGLSIKDNIDGYGRFVIAATASGLKLSQTNEIYDSFATALTVVGASAQQQTLAFYGLTEMMQKGVIYSKEFVRQIGAQIPGMAVVLAAALSKIEHRTVSVSDAFKQMHTGSLQTAAVLPELQKQLRQMYEPLLSLAQQRPDVAIQRLKNSFVIFGREVGQGKFMSVIGNEMKRLTDLIITGDGAGAHLTDSFQHLADQVSHGLGTAIHALGTGLEFVVKNFDTLFTVLKGFLAFKLAGEFSKITTGAINAASGMMKFSTAAQTAAASEAAVSSEARTVATQTAVAAIAAPAANEAAAISNLASGASFGRRRPASAFQRANGVVPTQSSFGNRLNLPLFNWADQNEASAARGARAATGSARTYTGAELRASLAARPSTGFFGSAITGGGAGRSLAGGIGSGIAGTFEKAASAMSLLGPAAVAAAVGLAMFSDKASGVTSTKGNSVTYGDIADGTLADIGDSVKNWVSDIGTSFGMFGDNALTLGKIVIGVVATIKSTFMLLFDLASALGHTIGGALSSFIAEVVNWGKVISDIVHGNVTGAIKDWRAGSAQQDAINKSAANQVGGDLTNIFTRDRIDTIYAAMSAAAGRAADNRVKGRAGDADNKQIEAAVQQNAAAQANMRAASLMEDAMAQFNKDTQKLNYDDIRKQIVDLIDGGYARQHGGPTPQDVAAATNVALQTMAATTTTKPILAAATGADSANVAVGTGARLYQTAFGHIGENERDDKDSLQSLFRTAGVNIDPQKAAWCAAFVNAVLASNGVVGTGKLDAASFKNFGDKVSKPQQGDIVVTKPLAPGDSGHVGFYAGANANGSVRILGGNQNDQVNISSFKASDVIGYRRPNQIGAATPAAAQLNAVGALADQAGEGDATTAASGPTPDADKIAKARLIEYKQIQAFAAGASPAAGAVSQDQERLANLQKIIDQEHQMFDKYGKDYKSVFDTSLLEQMDAAQVKYNRDLNDALDPVGKMARLQQETNDITAMRVKGLSNEADWQEQVNKLKEEGYAPSDIAKSKEQWQIEMDRASALSAQLELQKQLNDIETKRMDRQSNSGLDNLVNAQINAAAKPGENLAQARARLSASGQLGVIQQTATAQFAENRSSAVQGMGDEINSLQQSQGLNSDQKAYQSDYIKALQGMTGLSTDSLSRLSGAASDADKKIAASYASLKQELENPPGFQRWVDGLEPLSKRMEDLKVQFADGLSDNLTKALTGGKTDWTSMFKGLQEGVVKGQVDNLLGSLFKGLGLASPQSPQQAQMAAAQTFGTGADTFSSAVATFAQTIAVVGGASPSNAASAASASFGPDAGIPALRGSLDTAGGTGSALAAAAAPALPDGLRGSLTGNDDLAGANLTSATPAGLTAANDNGGFWDKLGGAVGWNDKKSTGDNIATMGLDALGLFGNLLFPGKKPDPTYHNPNGIIGTMSTNTVNGTYKAAQANPIGSLLNFAAQSAIGGNPGGATGAGGLLSKTGFFGNLFGGTGGGAGSLSSMLLSLFSEGGYSTSPVQKVMGGINMHGIPHYAEGTHNTSGIPAILHPDEAVIPLSRGRKIPVEMNDNNRGPANVTSNITVIAPNPDAFRKASGSIKRDQNRSLKRSATRNLTG